MLAVTRKNAIKDLLAEQKSVSITDLAARLNVTRETIRRDLKEMEEKGELIRTHGGAYILDGVKNDLDVGTRQVLMIPEKETIAEKCDKLIQPGDYILLDGSTTCWFIAKKIAARSVTVLTNSLEIANILSASETVKLHLTGGEYSPSNKTFTGVSAVSFLESHFVDKAFISCRSADLEAGITDTNDTSAAFRKAALSHASESFLVLDHTKLDKVSFAKISDLDAVTGCVLDTAFPDKWKEKLSETGVLMY
ncbi:MAG: DeoR/GlpR transcriptional regulator [Eubacterium sp.]|nr:DeoR/GlpR transcriptional regulator [Eubacterium sp.]